MGTRTAGSTGRAPATPETTSVLRHELVHHFAASIYRRQPRWFAEGLAQFLETVRVSEDGKSVVVGAVNLEALRKYHAFRSVRVADALSWSAKADTMSEETVHGLYGLSWVMVHWLYNAHPQQFDAAAGSPGQGHRSGQGLEDHPPGPEHPGHRRSDSSSYVKHGEYTEFLAPFTPPAPAAAPSTVLSEADVHAERARVALAAARQSSDPGRHREEAQARACPGPHDRSRRTPAPWSSVRGPPRPEQRAALARTLTTTHPEDGRGWMLLGGAARTRPRLPSGRRRSGKRSPSARTIRPR